MDAKLKEVLLQIEQTGAWYGIQIVSLGQRNPIDDTPLHTACSWGEMAPVKTLIDAGADVNAKGDQDATPLFNAVFGGSAEVVRVLVESGADPDRRDKWGRRPIDIARNVSASSEVISALEAGKVPTGH